jgi:hypothetical protein
VFTTALLQAFDEASSDEAGTADEGVIIGLQILSYAILIFFIKYDGRKTNINIRPAFNGE